MEQAAQNEKERMGYKRAIEPVHATISAKGEYFLESGERVTVVQPGAKDLAEEKLKHLGESFKRTDLVIAKLLLRREDLARQVAEIKHSAGVPTIRKNVEERRLEEFRQFMASQSYSDPEFARGILRQIIDRGVSYQVGLRETWVKRDSA
jgi:chorismate mutase